MQIANFNTDTILFKDPAVVTEKFVATREWQIIKEGQSIPRGLHVRMNLQTGLKEAKLLEEKVPESQHDNNLQKVYKNKTHICRERSLIC